MNAPGRRRIVANVVAAVVLVLGGRTAASGEEKAARPVGPPGTVTLPVTDYDLLVERAARPPKHTEPPPVPAVLARAEARLRVDKDTVRGTFQLEGEVFRTGATRVPLFPGDTLLDARTFLERGGAAPHSPGTPPLSIGKPLPLLRENGMHTAVLNGPSPFAVTLEWGTAVTQEPGRTSFILPVPPAGSARATLVLQGEQADVQVEPGIVTRRSSARGETLIEVTLVPGSRARFRWSSSREATAAAPREVRSLADLKTLVTLGEADLRLTVLVDVTVVQGEPDHFDLRLPAGFEVTSVSGASLESTREAQGVLTLTVRDIARRRQAFLVSLERDAPGASYRTDLPLPALVGAQRETGEVAIEGVGTLELQATEGGTLRRLDVREVHSSLRALARDSLLAAYRFHRRADEAPTLALEVKRFPDAPVLAAVAERAVATTLVTGEGRQLTEVSLTVRNHAQPFLKVTLPEGASLLSAEVAGEGVKPVSGADGTRVPLLRPGFKPSGPYSVSFVYLHSGTAFAKKGEATFGLPRMDIPVNVVDWELFLPERYRVKEVGGNVLRADLAGLSGRGFGIEEGLAGAVVGGLAETVTVVAKSRIDATTARSEALRDSLSADKRKDEPAQLAPSSNVANLQRRVAGVLPVRIDIPRTGASYRFVRPLVLDEETTVSLRYGKR